MPTLPSLPATDAEYLDHFRSVLAPFLTDGADDEPHFCESPSCIRFSGCAAYRYDSHAHGYWGAGEEEAERWAWDSLEREFASARVYLKESRAGLREVAAELAKRDPDWRRVAELANEASGYAGQIASDIEDGLGDNEPKE
jgi:hypothetical protein